MPAPRRAGVTHTHVGRCAVTLAAIGAPGVCLEWSITRTLAAGATEDEISEVLLVIAPAVGLGRVVGDVTDMADVLGYDVEAGLVDPDDH